MDLHNEIMNLQEDKEKMNSEIMGLILKSNNEDEKLYIDIYKIGFRDARHKAAKLVSERGIE